MVSRLLHALTDTAVSRRGKFLVIAIWVILTLALSVFAPKLATFYNANSTQSIPATADSQVAQRLLLQKFPASHGTPAVLVFSDPGGLSVNDCIHMHTVSDWLTSAQPPLSVGAQPEKETEAYQQLKRRKKMRWNTQQKLKSVVVLFICLPLTTLLAGCSNNASSQGNAQTARPTQTISTTQSIVITAIDYTYSMPTTLTLHAGLVDLTLINNGTQPHQAQFARLNPGVTRDQVVEQLITKRDQAAAFSLLTFVGGPDTISAGDGQETILNLEPGEYVLLCLVTGSDGLPHIDKGMIHFLTVATSQSQEALPQVDGEIVIHNHDYVLPESLLQARPLTLQVQNQGTEPHELNIVRLNTGKNLHDILSFFRALSGRPPFEEFGGMATLAAESSGWLKLDLEPGNYAVLSAIPDPHTGVFQEVQGLLAAFTVH